MSISKIKEKVLSKEKVPVDIPFSELESLIETDINFPDKKKWFTIEGIPTLSKEGFECFVVGNKIRFNKVPTSSNKTSKPKIEVKNQAPVALHKNSATSNNFLDFASSEPGSKTQFGHDYIYPAEFKYVKAAMQTEGCFPMLVGSASSGKSRMCEEICRSLPRHDRENNVIGTGIPFVRINMEEIEETSDLVGSTQLITNPNTQTSETIYVPGILLEAWVNGWIIIFDEIDRSSKAARKQLNMITEIGGQLMVPTHEGFKFFDKHPDAGFVFTANTWGHGDFTSMYDGAEPLNTAWLSRIGPKIEIRTDWAIFKEVLAQYNLDEKVIYLLLEKDGGILQNIEETIRTQQLQESISLRSLIRFAKLYPTFGWHFGLEVCFINEFQEFNRDIVRGIFQSEPNSNDMVPTSDFNEINSENKKSALKNAGL